MNFCHRALSAKKVSRFTSVIDFTGLLEIESGAKLIIASNSISPQHLNAKVPERISDRFRVPLDYAVARYIIHTIRKQIHSRSVKLVWRSAPPLLQIASKGFIPYVIVAGFVFFGSYLKRELNRHKILLHELDGLLIESVTGKSSRLTPDFGELPTSNRTSKNNWNGIKLAGLHSDGQQDEYGALIQDGFLPSNNSLSSEKSRLKSRALFVRSALDLEIARKAGINAKVDKNFLIRLPERVDFEKKISSKALVCLNHVGFWTPDTYLGSTWEVLKWSAYFAKTNPDIVVSIRPHPGAKHIFHEGKRLQHHYADYVSSLNLKNLRLIPSNSTQLIEDFEANDLVLSEYSDTVLMAVKSKKLAAFLIPVDRPSQVQAFVDMGFPSVLTREFSISTKNLNIQLNNFLENWNATYENLFESSKSTNF